MTSKVEPYVERLLEAWHDLEPLTCEYNSCTFREEEVFFYSVFIDHREYEFYFNEPEDFRYPYHDIIIIQGAVQEAIEKRGWTWSKQGRVVTVIEPHERVLSRISYTDDTCQPSVSLLAAYVKAIVTYSQPTPSVK